MREWKLVVPPELDGRKVERALSRGLGLSATRIKRAKFREDGILLEGRRVNTAAIVHTGQTLTVRLPEREKTDIVSAEGALEVLYEDEWLIALNKPAGMPTHPCSGHTDDTLANRLAQRERQAGRSFVFRAVNRLDIGTSGVLIAAKSAEAQERLQALLHTDEFVRTYLALTDRCPPRQAGRIDVPLAPEEGRHAYCVSPAGKPAVTDYRVMGQAGDICCVQLRLHTGRTHQIRVHMASIGCPLVGDALYGGSAAMSRPALHSQQVLLHHPFTGEWLKVDTPIPADMRSLISTHSP